MNVEEANKHPRVLELRKKVKQVKDKSWRSKMNWARNAYLNRQKRGIYSYMVVDEWEKFEIEFEKEKIKQKRGEKEMAKFRMIVRLSKDFNNAEIGVEDVESIEELESYEIYIKGKVKQIVETLPVYEKGAKQVKTSPKTATKTFYPNTQSNTQAPQGKVTRSDITLISKDQDQQNGYGSEKQFGFLVQGVNQGKLTLHEVNSCQDYQQVADLVKKFFSS